MNCRVPIKFCAAIGIMLLLLSACAGSPKISKAAEQLPAPTKEIIVSRGDLSQPYTVLGNVEYEISNVSMYSSTVDMEGNPSPELRKEAEEGLRRTAFGKFGAKVDAIINAKTIGSWPGGFWAMMGGAYGAHNSSVRAEGIAVSFK